MKYILYLEELIPKEVAHCYTIPCHSYKEAKQILQYKENVLYYRISTSYHKRNK